MSKTETRTKETTKAVKSNNRYIVRLGLTLFIITSVTALLLAGVNALTKDRIYGVELNVVDSAIQTLMPGSTVLDSNTLVTDSYTVYTLESSDGSIGYCVETAPLGYAAPINMIVGIEVVYEGSTIEKRVLGVVITSMDETAGLGTKAKDEPFLSQFEGATYKVVGDDGIFNSSPSEIKIGTDNSDIDVISGATMTTQAVVDGVNVALDAIVITNTGEVSIE